MFGNAKVAEAGGPEELVHMKVDLAPIKYDSKKKDCAMITFDQPLDIMLSYYAQGATGADPQGATGRDGRTSHHLA